MQYTMPEPTPLLAFNAESIVDTVREPMLVLSADGLQSEPTIQRGERRLM